ncbi:MAG: DUF1634 domain-containing protein [Bacillota bacterium]
MNDLVQHRRWLTAWILRLSIGLCLLLIVLGLALFLAQGGARVPAIPRGSLKDIFDAAVSRGEAFHAGAFLDAGLVVLLLTPVARLVAGVYISARGRDWLYVAIGVIVLGLVLLGLMAGQAGG